MPASAKALAPATRKARDEVKSSIWLTVGVSTLVRVSRWLDAVALSLGAGLCHISSMGAWAPCRIGGSWVVFRNDVIAVSAEPDVTMVIDKTAMGSMRQVTRIAVCWSRLDHPLIAATGDQRSESGFLQRRVDNKWSRRGDCAGYVPPPQSPFAPVGRGSELANAKRSC